MKEKADDSMTLSDLIRQLDTAEVFQEDMKHDTPLRLGKLRGNARGSVYHLWGAFDC